MSLNENPYAPPTGKGKAEGERAYITRRSAVIARAGLFASTCFAIGSVGLPVGIGLTAMYGFDATAESIAPDATKAGVVILGVSVGLLMLGVFQMVGKSQAASRRRSQILDPEEHRHI